MDSHEFSPQEIAVVRGRFPKLELTTPGTWEGSIDFDHIYREVRILSTFAVRIVAPDGYPAKIPIAYDIGGRAKTVGHKHGIKDLQNIHHNPKDGSICLCVRQEESKKFPPGSTLINFMEDLVIPYFYGLEYYNEQGKWPWREYSHGGLGIMEYHAEDPAVQTRESIARLASYLYGDDDLKRYKRYLLKPMGAHCVCGSGYSFESCHDLAWKGLLRFGEDMRKLNLNPKKLLLPWDRWGRPKVQN